MYLAKYQFNIKIFRRILPVLAVAIAFTVSGCNLSQSPEPQKIGEALTSVPPIKPSPKIQLLYTIPGHLRFSVTSVAISPDGQILVSGSNDNTIKIWNMHTGKSLHTLSGHSRGVNSIAISRDGRTLASGSDDKTIKIWNLLTGKLLRTLNGHSDLVASVAFSPNEQILASGSSDGTINLWDYRTGKLLRTLTWSIGANSVAFSPDGQTLASGSSHKIKLWNLRTGKLFSTLLGHSDSIESVAFSPDGQTLASSSDDKTITVWNFRTRELLRTLSADSGWFNYDFDPNATPVYAVAFSSDGQILASSSVKNDIKIWNFRTGELLRTLTQHSDVVHSIAFSPDGQIFASGSQDGTIKIWSVSSKPTKFLWFN